MAAGPYDGEWVGTVVLGDSLEQQCGFTNVPFRARVEGNLFVGTGKDGIGDSERVFEGEVDADGRISAWGKWAAAYQISGDLLVRSASLTGQFGQRTFTGQLNSLSDYGGGCAARVVMRRRGDDGRVAGAGSLVAAAERGDAPALVAAIRGGADVNVANRSGTTPLMGAVANGDATIVRLLLEAGADEAAVDGDGRTALDLAEESAQTEILALLQDVDVLRGTASAAARRGKPATGGGTAAAEAERLRQEIERLKAETERQRLMAEVERLKSERLAAGGGTAAAEAERLRQEIERLKAENERKRLMAEVERLKAEAGRQQQADTAQIRELALWTRIKDSDRAEDFQGYVAAYPRGLFADTARARIASLGARAAQAAAATEERLWRSIESSRKPNDFKDYLARYPDGRFKGKAQTRLTVLAKFAAVEGIDFGDYHALVIGNNAYKHLPGLKTAVGDAKAVAGALKGAYGFKVTLLIDATRDDIIDALDVYVETLQERDNLLIYYAGHGWLSEDAGRGYWLPVDARKNRRSKWLSNATITDTLKTLQAKHVMVVADSCYSGTLTRGSGVKLRSADYWKRMATKRARVVLTSGGLEPVADAGGGGHSPFAKAFIKALQANDAVMDGTQLFADIRRPVMIASEQMPEYSDARNAGHDGGDFLFVRSR